MMLLEYIESVKQLILEGNPFLRSRFNFYPCQFGIGHVIHITTRTLSLQSGSNIYLFHPRMPPECAIINTPIPHKRSVLLYVLFEEVHRTHTYNDVR